MSRVIIVANRLPVVAKRSGTALTWEKSSGGLVSGLSCLQDRPIIWVGWPGVVPDECIPQATTDLESMGHFPAFLPATLSDLFYEGFCNGALWPVLHSMPMYSKTLDEEYAAFVKATNIFADAIQRVYKPGDVLWIQDYHLLLLPAEVRRRLGKNVTIAFFLHIPFPSVDVFRLLPSHEVIMDSLLQVDLAGFHTTEYVSNFIGCMSRLRGLSPVLGRLLVPSTGQLIQVSAFPMGIDFAKYNAACTEPGPQKLAKAIRAHLDPAEKVVFSVARLDYTKGVPHSLVAIRSFFKDSPEWIGKIVFVLVVVPSRTHVDKYAELKQEIDRLVGELNGEFGTLTWSPVIYMYRSLGWDELIGLYSAADVGLVIPLRDGMNLCAKEYVAVHANTSGVLVLSNLAGAAKELIEAVIVNPNSTDSIVAGLKQALAMPSVQQVSRNMQMAKRIQQMDITFWTKSIFKQLDEVKEMQQKLSVSILDQPAREKMLQHFLQAKTRLLVLDYDGTLVPFVNNPSEAAPDAELVDILQELTQIPNTTVLVLSGRDKVTLGKWLGALSLDIAAEHGAWHWSPSKGCWTQNPKLGNASEHSKWKAGLRPLMEDAVRVLPGAFVEEKEYSLVFHFRACSSGLSFHVLERQKMMDVVLTLKATLLANVAGLPVRVMDAKEAIEVKAIGTSKGEFYLSFLHSLPVSPGFVLAAGDDTTDEDLFEAMPFGYSIRVGFFPSSAHYNIADCSATRELLRSLALQAKSVSHELTRLSFSI
jgi:trehalose 6-phosphate synthase/phosphatase